ncbi:hypothetical protein EI94DRAFT_1810892 [Lactarius quietus]|nr:hypothetical protein EI94DRAFT_1810892 [Lactarius quietus]
MFPLLSPSDDLRPLPPPIIAESQWGEPRSIAFGTGMPSPSTGWSPWGDAPTFLCRRPLGHLPFTAVADSQWGHWGELHLEAFVTDACVARSSITVVGPAALVGNH